MEPPAFRLHDTLSRTTKPLEPAERDADGRPVLRFYSCGPTVYSFAHVGNFRTFLTADLVVRTAEALGWRVRYVSNVTDVGHLTEDDAADAQGEDRMEKALRSKEGARFANVWDLARHYTEVLLEDWRLLNLRDPEVRPRATEHLREQVVAAEQLIRDGHAYETPDGVYFHVPSFPDYGALSGNRDLEALSEADRAIVRDENKKDPRDFALWKKAVGVSAGHLMQWHSPFGWGFPGWHLECSVMAQRYLGDTLDLHGGGEDLRFPHHECEIAQSEALTGQPFARHWLHTRFLLVEGQKMSKRLGNFLTVRDLTQHPEAGGREDWGAPVDPLALRLALISGHYGKPLDFTKKGLRDAALNARRFREADEAAREGIKANKGQDDALGGVLEETYQDALAAMANDLNTPEALAAALRGSSLIRIERDNRDGRLPTPAAHSAADFLDRINALLGIVRPEYAAPATREDDAFAEEVEALLAERVAARRAKDWARADALRAQVDALGVEVMDGPEGSTWRRKV